MAKKKKEKKRIIEEYFLKSSVNFTVILDHNKVCQKEGHCFCGYDERTKTRIPSSLHIIKGEQKILASIIDLDIIKQYRKKGLIQISKVKKEIK